ncbi:hypothetical protein [Microbacterium oxydans]|uniref:Transcriptional regulator, AbiEi antitoxin, Type IV TA system n=1 Tax=Microbacterium oxydans TaxID=82380 RepID=A0A0F0L7E5_9MICO|nr:hypothetical protein [Microbacterium oxydans]KJL28614.1 hypothetical protein RS83_02085 [Microbacterium oxydans]
MRHATVDEIADILISSRRLNAEGWTSRTLRSAIDARRLHRVRRGWFVEHVRWVSLSPESRHRAEVVAAALSSAGSEPIFSHASAAVLWGLPLYRLRPERVHVLTPPDHRHSTQGILRHEGALPDSDIVELDGIRCTSLARTVFDVVRTVSGEAALAVADAALASLGGEPWDYDENAADALLGELAIRAGRPGARGILQARRIVELADGRAQLPLESVTRYRLHQLGFARPRLQVPIERDGASKYWMDIALDQSHTFIECDGREKYLNAELRGDRSADDVVLAEKMREDWVRGTTGWRVARVMSEHVRTLDAAESHFRAVGLFARRRSA